MKGWQYRFLKLEANQAVNERRFEQLGLDGWEFMATYSTSSGNHLNNTAIFKKPLNGVKSAIKEKIEPKKEEPDQIKSAQTKSTITESTLTEPVKMETAPTEPTLPAQSESAIAEKTQAESASAHVKFGTLEWYQRMADWLNKDSEWLKGGLTTTFLYVYTDVTGPDGQPKAILMKSDNGKVTVSEGKAADLSSKEIEFGTTATYQMHAGIAKGEINPQKAKLKFSMGKAIKNQGTLKRQSVAMKEISSETEF